AGRRVRGGGRCDRAARVGVRRPGGRFQRPPQVERKRPGGLPDHRGPPPQRRGHPDEQEAGRGQEREQPPGEPGHGPGCGTRRPGAEHRKLANDRHRRKVSAPRADRAKMAPAPGAGKQSGAAVATRTVTWARMNRWAILAGYGLLAACTQLLWLTYAPITTQAHRVMGVSEGAVGDLAAIFALMYVVLALPSGRWLDARFER